METFRAWIRSRLDRAGLYLCLLGGWTVLAMGIGVFSGLLGAAFHHSVHLAGIWREAHPALLWLLPGAGLAIVALDRYLGTVGQGTNDILDEIHLGKGISPQLLPSVFVCTFLTHLCGGSAGREGAALQMGGVIGYHAGRLCCLDDAGRRSATTAGMAAFFAALFGTPLAATVFALTVVSVGRFYSADLLPSLTAALTACAMAWMLRVEPTRFAVSAPALGGWMLLRVIVLAAACALLSVLFCETVHGVRRVLKRRIPNPWLRGALGGGIVILLTLLCGVRDYNGAGMEVLTAAVEQGAARPGAFAWKLLFTAVTLGAGFKGGEVVPSFFVGATFGAFVGPFVGIPAPFAASVGLVCVFCGATNCPLASIFLAIELFGDGGLLYYAAACVLSYVLSGYSGLYSSQTIIYSKVRARYLNVHTNAHHLGEAEELK